MAFSKSLSAALIATVALMAFAWPLSAAADDKGVTLELVIPPEKVDTEEAEQGFAADTLAEITTEAAERIRQRMRAAEIKHWDVVTSGRNHIRVSVYGRYSRGRLASILVPTGDMSIRPVLSVGDEWTERIARVPDGVELRQPDESMRADAAFLWSRSRRVLREVVQDVPLPGVDVDVYPYKGGWRTVALGTVVATHKSVRKASIERGGGGDAYVRLQLDATSAPERTNRHSVGSRWALVLDGEVVRVWQEASDTLDTAINLRPPSHLGSKEARLIWSQQVAGRLAAYIPVPLVEVEDVDQD